MKKAYAVIPGAVAAVTAATIVSAGPAQAAAFNEQVLTEHNAARARYGAHALNWGPSLYPSTLQHARSCRFANSIGPYGENLYSSPDPNATIADAMAAWMSEESKYDYDSPGSTPDTARFTQVVWKATTQVAAAIVRCPAGTLAEEPATFIVARYSPPGNVADQFAQNVGRQVT
ncbi:CAP domain-containing protein [Nocardia arizonensis]|uniref:CAP domain-containing protein n=1 Tax=Nocardia arizonensis TaxID=1141647 RepID=UPI0006D102BE|nr:CAP domain-containing protein [Nocardia arizonensis]